MPARRQNETSRPSSFWILVVTPGSSEKVQSSELNWDLSLCLFVGFPCYELKLPGSSSLSLYCCLPWRYTSDVRIWAKTRKLIALTLLGKHAQTYTLLLPSQSPKWATFPCSTSCSNGSLQRRRDTVINQKTQRHSTSATDAQCRSTLIEEKYLNVTGEDKLQGSVYRSFNT